MIRNMEEIMDGRRYIWQSFQRDGTGFRVARRYDSSGKASGVRSFRKNMFHRS